MTAIGVKGVISVDLGVTDLARSKDFYTRVWLLSPVLETNSAVYLRGSAPYHHILALHRRPTAELLRINLMAPERQSVDTLHARIAGTKPSLIEAPAESSEPDGGYGFAFKDPEGRTVRILTNDHPQTATLGDPDKPKKVTHVVMNTPNRAAMAAYYCEGMNFRVIDETKLMTFLCAGTDHHCIALMQHSTVSLNHIAFETANIDAVMRGIGRLRENGVPVEWGAGRHGPGNNVFAYFIGPGREIIEYTSEVMQVDDNYRVGTPNDWGFPAGRFDHWSVTAGPTANYTEAQGRIPFAREIFHPDRPSVG
jgi:catechol 2,3-dioxygenase-like lactoylglutathione lyase family enzyme